MADVLNVFLGVLGMLSFAVVAYLGGAYFAYAKSAWQAILALAAIVFGVSGFITIIYTAVNNLKPF